MYELLLPCSFIVCFPFFSLIIRVKYSQNVLNIGTINVENLYRKLGSTEFIQYRTAPFVYERAGMCVCGISVCHSPEMWEQCAPHSDSFEMIVHEIEKVIWLSSFCAVIYWNKTNTRAITKLNENWIWSMQK